MIYKRKESFRFTFNPPPACIFNIVEVDNMRLDSRNAEGILIDISPSGAKLASKLDIPIHHKKIKIKLSFKINEDTIYANGILIWKKTTQLGNNYGVQFVNASDLTDVIMEELKTYVKLKK